MQLHQTERALVGLTKAFIAHQPPQLQSEADVAVWAVCGYCLSFTLMLANDLHMAHEYASLLFVLLDKHLPKLPDNPLLLRVKAQVCLLLAKLAVVPPPHAEDGQTPRRRRLPPSHRNRRPPRPRAEQGPGAGLLLLRRKGGLPARRPGPRLGRLLRAPRLERGLRGAARCGQGLLRSESADVRCWSPGETASDSAGSASCSRNRPGLAKPKRSSCCRPGGRLG